MWHFLLLHVHTAKSNSYCLPKIAYTVPLNVFNYLKTEDKIAQRCAYKFLAISGIIPHEREKEKKNEIIRKLKTLNHLLQAAGPN